MGRKHNRHEEHTGGSSTDAAVYFGRSSVNQHVCVEVPSRLGHICLGCGRQSRS